MNLPIELFQLIVNQAATLCNEEHADDNDKFAQSLASLLANCRLVSKQWLTGVNPIFFNRSRIMIPTHERFDEMVNAPCNFLKGVQWLFVGKAARTFESAVPFCLHQVALLLRQCDSLKDLDLYYTGTCKCDNLCEGGSLGFTLANTVDLGLIIAQPGPDESKPTPSDLYLLFQTMPGLKSLMIDSDNDTISLLPIAQHKGAILANLECLALFNVEFGLDNAQIFDFIAPESFGKIKAMETSNTSWIKLSNVAQSALSHSLEELGSYLRSDTFINHEPESAKVTFCNTTIFRKLKSVTTAWTTDPPRQLGSAFSSFRHLAPSVQKLTLHGHPHDFVNLRHVIDAFDSSSLAGKSLKRIELEYIDEWMLNVSPTGWPETNSVWRDMVNKLARCGVELVSDVKGNDSKNDDEDLTDDDMFLDDEEWDVESDEQEQGEQIYASD